MGPGNGAGCGLITCRAGSGCALTGRAVFVGEAAATGTGGVCAVLTGEVLAAGAPPSNFAKTDRAFISADCCTMVLACCALNNVNEVRMFFSSAIFDRWKYALRLNPASPPVIKIPAANQETWGFSGNLELNANII